MTDHCAPTFEQLADALGFSCRTAGGPVAVRNPFALENWTLPVLEVAVILGSVLFLVHAVVRLRRHGDPVNLVLWFGATAYLFVIEPPLYFPAAFGIDGSVDTMFAHNVFSVDFLWGRLPLYIVAIYPFMATLAYEIVRMLGVFERYGLLVSAACVGFAHHAFYEIFDQLGPQLRWWEWSTTNPLNQPMFDSVPLPSVVVFAALWPMSLAWCVQYFVGRRAAPGRRFTGVQLVWRTIAIGLAASAGTFILPLPATVLGIAGTTVRGVVYSVELAAVACVAFAVAARLWRRRREPVGEASVNLLVLCYGAVYLAVMAVLWAAALPEFLRAVDGVTAGGDPTGNLWYTVACFAVAGCCLAGAAFRATQTSRMTREVRPVHLTGHSGEP